METCLHFSKLSGKALLAETRRLVGCEQSSTADVIEALAEIDARKLFFEAGFNSLFAYCTDELLYTEDAACTRIEAARISRMFPAVVDRLRHGTLSLTNLRLVIPLLTIENHQMVLDRIKFKRKRDVELLVTGWRPQPDVLALVRRLPQPAAVPTREKARQAENSLEFAAADAESANATLPPTGLMPPPPFSASRVAVPTPATRPRIAPLAPERYKVQFTADQATHDLLRRAQSLLRHQVPNGDLLSVFNRALVCLVQELERKKAAIVSRPRTAVRPSQRHSRHIPADVRREVWTRDGGRCAFEGARGRCPETGCLEFHHVFPFAEGGRATVANIELRCRAHNGYESTLMFPA